MINRKKFKDYVSENYEFFKDVIFTDDDIKATTKIIVKCKICGHESTLSVGSYVKNNHKPHCKNCLSLNFKRNDLVKYLKNYDDRLLACNDKRTKITIVCTDCGMEKITTPHLLTTYGVNCKFCSDKRPTPERFMSRLLEHLQIKYFPQYKFDWSNGKIYDFYIPSLNMIIETHGEQHYVESFKNFNKYLKDIKSNDSYKKKVATENGINLYIEVDCRTSELIYLKNNAIDSLSHLINLDSVDWNEIFSKVHESKLKQVCELWNSKLKGET